MQKALFPLAVLVGVTAAILLYYSGLAYQRGSLELGQAFTLMRYAAYTGIVGMALGIFCLFVARPAGALLFVLVLAILLSGSSFLLPYRQQLIAAGLPAIHDISTDLINPPPFDAIIPWRTGAANPPEYDGPEVASQQSAAYPDIKTLELNASAEQVFSTALALVEDRGWAVAASADGRIEATVSTQWFGFKDDVVIRVQSSGPGARFDMRSKSRIGRHDIGANAARIRAFVADLTQALQ